MRHDALVPPSPADALVLPTPLWEFVIALGIGWVLWRLGAKPRAVGWLTGMYLVMSGVARFVVEFWRINPRLYLGMSNAQVAALGSVVLGAVVIGLAQAKRMPWGPRVVEESAT